LNVKVVKFIAIPCIVYVGIVVAFESMIGIFQPASQSTLVITTQDSSGVTNDRVLARIESDGKVYVAANHWPRAWYEQALENPNVQVAFKDEQGDYLAVPISGPEHDRVNADNPTGLAFRILTGFPPRYFVRLDPGS
jgi:hypothetical protein